MDFKELLNQGIKMLNLHFPFCGIAPTWVKHLQILTRLDHDPVWHENMTWQTTHLAVLWLLSLFLLLSEGVHRSKCKSTGKSVIRIITMSDSDYLRITLLFWQFSLAYHTNTVYFTNRETKQNIPVDNFTHRWSISVNVLALCFVKILLVICCNEAETQEAVFRHTIDSR